MLLPPQEPSPPAPGEAASAALLDGMRRIPGGEFRMGSDRHYPEVPGSPAPMSGAIHIFSPDKVTLLGVPPLCLMEAISSRGLGLREMVEGVGADQRAAHAVPGRSA